MIEGLPNWVNLLFLLTVGITVLLFYYANGSNKKVLSGLIVWSILHSVLAYTGFYQQTNGFPPRFVLVLVPAAVFIVLGLLPRYRNKLLKSRNRVLNTFLHTVRVPVEIVLFLLFMHKMVPELMTFEGRNFDILAGLTAPVVGLLLLTKKAGNTVFLVWNMVALGLVCFIMFNGILSSELPFQQFGFEQPNKAILYFPFVLLPAVIVPLVLYTHLAEILILLKERKAMQVPEVDSLGAKQ